MRHLFFAFFAILFTQSATAQIIVTFAGDGMSSSLGDGSHADSASFNNPSGICRDNADNTYIVEYGGNRIRKVSPSGIVSTIAGTGAIGFSGDGGPATAATFHTPVDILIDSKGNLYITDNANHRIRKIDTTGIITTFAGNGTIGYTGDGGPATGASLSWPSRMAKDEAGNLYLADALNNVIRMIDTTGIIHTVAGNGSASFSGDGGPATEASLSEPLGVAFDGNGNMYIADGHNSRIRKVNTSGIITTWAGNGIYGFSGDGGPATAASMQYPDAIAVDKSCNVFFTDWDGQRVRKITSTGYISTITGTGVPGYSGDGGLANIAEINGPDNLAFDNQSNLYIPDFNNNRIREVEKAGDTTGCPPVTPISAFVTADSSVCQDSCITFTSTSTGMTDSMRWAVTGASVANPTDTTTTICFLTPGSITVHLYVYGPGGADTSSKTLVVTNCSSTGVITHTATLANFWVCQLNGNSISLNSSQLPDAPLAVGIYDAEGSRIFNGTWNKNVPFLEINDLRVAPGMYIIKLGNGTVLKWIKSN